MAKYEVRADTAKNRLYIILDGFFNDEEFKVAVDLIIERAKTLKKDFDVINDITTFKPASQTSLGEMKRAQVFIKENGARRVIRVMDQASISSMQLARTGKEAGYDADVAASIAEAEKMLGN